MFIQLVKKFNCLMLCINPSPSQQPLQILQPKRYIQILFSFVCYLLLPTHNSLRNNPEPGQLSLSSYLHYFRSNYSGRFVIKFTLLLLPERETQFDGYVKHHVTYLTQNTFNYRSSVFRLLLQNRFCSAKSDTFPRLCRYLTEISFILTRDLYT